MESDGSMKMDCARQNNRLLIADRCGKFRQAAERLLNGWGKWSCRTVGTAEEARDWVEKWDPAVVILEHELPGNGNGAVAEWLRQYRPIPVIAIQRGRWAGVTGPYWAVIGRESDAEGTLLELAHLLAAKLTTARPASERAGRFIATGASKGGNVAREQMLPGLPEDGPEILIAQPIPPQYIAMLAERLNRVTALECKRQTTERRSRTPRRRWRQRPARDGRWTQR